MKDVLFSAEKNAVFRRELSVVGFNRLNREKASKTCQRRFSAKATMIATTKAMAAFLDSLGQEWTRRCIAYSRAISCSAYRAASGPRNAWTCSLWIPSPYIWPRHPGALVLRLQSENFVVYSIGSDKKKDDNGRFVRRRLNEHQVSLRRYFPYGGNYCIPICFHHSMRKRKMEKLFPEVSCKNM